MEDVWQGYPIQCSKCGGKLTPAMYHPEKHRVVRGCWRCREHIDVTETWLETVDHRTHMGCGGAMITFLDPNSFDLSSRCLKCGFSEHAEPAVTS